LNNTFDGRPDRHSDEDDRRIACRLYADRLDDYGRQILGAQAQDPLSGGYVVETKHPGADQLPGGVPVGAANQYGHDRVGRSARNRVDDVHRDCGSTWPRRGRGELQQEPWSIGRNRGQDYPREFRRSVASFGVDRPCADKVRPFGEVLDAKDPAVERHGLAEYGDSGVAQSVGTTKDIVDRAIGLQDDDPSVGGGSSVRIHHPPRHRMARCQHDALLGSVVP
jgi:hypothetical protein